MELSDRLLDLAIRFRDAIEANTANIGFWRLDIFPAGCCDGSSYLLSEYLRECGFKDIQMVFGVRTDRRSAFGERLYHAWLEVKGVYVDLTANQYDDAPARARPARTLGNLA